MKKVIMFCCFWLLTGCATVFTGTMQTISLQAVDAEDQEVIPDVKCTIRDNNGTVYFLNSNPGSVSVKKGQAPLTPICKKKGYRQIHYAVGESFNAVTIVNVLFWPGFLVDAMTGSLQKYPSHIVVTMERK